MSDVMDRMVIVAGQAIDAHPWAAGKPMVPSEVIRVALEAAAQAAPAPESWIETAMRGYANWAAKEHNAKWVRKIDGTPIPNDLPVCIGQAFADLAAAQAAPAPTATPGEYDKLLADIDAMVQLNPGNYTLWEQAAAAIRKLTAEVA